jgi:ribosomal-protein-alanine N-acetyltransferase
MVDSNVGQGRMDTTNTALTTERLDLAAWHVDDAEAGLTIFGRDEVSRWLTPAMGPVSDETAMRETIAKWLDEDREGDPPLGHWTVRLRDSSTLVGSITLRWMPPFDEDRELAWQFAPEHWGHGYATEAARAVANWAFDLSAHELFAVMRPGNERAAKLARRLGMQWVGETDKYYDLRLNVYRLLPPDLIASGMPPGAVNE